MALTPRVWASGTPPTSGTPAWAAVAAATGAPNGAGATWTNPGSGAVGWIAPAGYNLQTAIGVQPTSIQSVSVQVAWWLSGNTTRWSSVAVQLVSPAGTLIGSPQAATLSTTVGNSQTFTFTGVTWAQLANLGVRVTATKSGTQNSTLTVDAVGVQVDYSPPTPVSGTAGGTLPSLTGSASAVLTSAQVHLVAATYSAVEANLLLPGTLTGTAAALTGSAVAQLTTAGDIAVPLLAVTGSADGVVSAGAALAGTVPALAGDVAGTLTTFASTSSAVPALSGELTAAVSPPAQVQLAHASYAAIAYAAAGVEGAVAASFPSLTGSLAGGALPQVQLTAAAYAGIAYTPGTISGAAAGNLPALTGSLTAAATVAQVMLTSATYDGSEVDVPLDSYTDVYPGPAPTPSTGSLTASLPALGGQVPTTVRTAGAPTGDLPALLAELDFEVGVSSGLNGTLGALSAAIPAAVASTGSVSGTFAPLTGQVIGAGTQVTGQVVSAFPPLSGTVPAAVAVEYAATGGSFAPLTGTFTAGQAARASVLGTLPPFTGAGTATVQVRGTLELGLRGLTTFLTAVPDIPIPEGAGITVVDLAAAGLGAVIERVGGLTHDELAKADVTLYPSPVTGLGLVTVAVHGLSVITLAVPGITVVPVPVATLSRP